MFMRVLTGLTAPAPQGVPSTLGNTRQLRRRSQRDAPYLNAEHRNAESGMWNGEWGTRSAEPDGFNHSGAARRDKISSPNLVCRPGGLTGRSESFCSAPGRGAGPAEASHHGGVNQRRGRLLTRAALLAAISESRRSAMIQEQ